jgi:hypothetical protein
MAAGRAGLRCGRGATPKGAGDENLWLGRLNERRQKHQREIKEEEGRFFTSDELFQ